MKLYKYKSYEEYKKVQISANKSKINSSWVDTNSIGGLTKYIFEHNDDVKFGLCHGTRRGLEQQAFIDNFDLIGKTVEVIGTEISDTASTYPHTIEWDFHNVKKEWLGKVDFIYSNSLDQSYKPKECLDVWMSCLGKLGLCILEWTWNHGDVHPPNKFCNGINCTHSGSKRDPFGATLKEYKSMIKEKYVLKDVLTNDSTKDTGETHRGERFFLVIENE